MYDPSNSSVSTNSADDYYSINRSSAPTSPGESETGMDKSESPDLLQTEFYNSDNLKDHARNFRLSMIHSDSMDSFKFQHFTEKTTGIAMTNSPSFSALASILEKKSNHRASPLQKNQSSETIIPIKEEEEPNTPILINLEQNTEQDSPNLIQFDDVDETPQQSHYSQDQYNSRHSVSYNHQQNEDDIFKTPEIKQSQQFTVKPYQSMLSAANEKGIVPEIIDTPQPNEMDNFQSYSTKKTVASPKPSVNEQYNEKPLPLPKPSKVSSFQTPELQSEEEDSKTFPTHYKRRSTSLPILTEQAQEPKKEKKKGFFSMFKTNKRSSSTSGVQQSNTVKPVNKFEQQKSQSNNSHDHIAKRSNSSTSLFSAFKRKSKIINIEESPKSNNETISTVSTPEQPSRSYASPRNTRSSSLLEEGVPTTASISHSFKENEKAEINHNYNNDDLDEDFDEDFNDDFTEDFNNISLNQRPTSQISQHGETLFPKSLSAQEVESIVSLERNRSLRSNRTSNSHIHNNQFLQINNPQNRLSLTDAISLNAKEEGMSIEFGKESSIPDLTKSPTQSALKRTSLSSYRRSLIDDEIENDEDYYEDDEDDELFNVEKFAATGFEFDDIAENYNNENENIQLNGDDDEEEEEEEDISNLMEFADFIDFGGDMDLNFDFGSTKSTPLSSPALNQLSVNSSPHEVIPTYPLKHNQLNASHASSIPSAASPSLNSIQGSPLSSPFLHQSAYLPTNDMSRPISMSFRGLKAPVFENPHFIVTGSETDTNSVRSHQSSIVSKIVVEQPRKVTFSSKITLYDVYHADDYDRHPDIATCNQLTPLLAQQIRSELNQVKSEMAVHEDSRCYTHFF